MDETPGTRKSQNLIPATHCIKIDTNTKYLVVKNIQFMSISIDHCEDINTNSVKT